MPTESYLNILKNKGKWMATPRQPYSKNPDSLKRAAAVLPKLIKKGSPSDLKEKERLASLRLSPEPPPILRNNTREIYHLLREEEEERRNDPAANNKTRVGKKRKTPESDADADDVSNKEPKLIPPAEHGAGAGSGLEKKERADDLKSGPDFTVAEKSTWFPVVESTGEIVLYPSLFYWVSRQAPETFSMLKNLGLCIHSKP